MNVSESTLRLDLGTRLRRDFPLFQNTDVVYLDSAASAQKPNAVLQSIEQFYRTSYANIHRGVYPLSEQATEQYDEARVVVANFIGAESEREVIFTPGATQSINLVASTWARQTLKEGDEIVLTILEHHANIVPWQMLAEEIGVKLRFVTLNEDQSFNRVAFREALSEKTKLLACTHLSNALGLQLPVKELIEEAREVGATVLIDASQSVTHFPINVTELDPDFLVFSGHKLYGPTGIGVLYGKQKLLESMPPFLGGGDMIREVRVDGTEYAEVPMKFEAGTPNITGAIGLAAAIRYVADVGLSEIAEHEASLLSYAEEQLENVDGVQLLGPKGQRVALLSMVFDGAHSLDVAQLLASKNIAVRAGHHCAQPLMQYLGFHDTLRASFGLYSTAADVDAFVSALSRTLSILRD